MQAKPTKVHAFEEKGLGKAPFHCVAVDRLVGPVYVHEGPMAGFTVGAPGQPMGSCDYCGTAIAERYHIRSADHRLFVVGCDCVRRTGSAGLLEARVVREYKRAQREAKREAQLAQVRSAVDALLVDEGVRARLVALPHPDAYMAGKGLTLLGWAEFLRAHGGLQGLRRLLGVLQKHAAELQPLPAATEQPCMCQACQAEVRP